MQIDYVIRLRQLSSSQPAFDENGQDVPEVGRLDAMDCDFELHCQVQHSDEGDVWLGDCSGHWWVLGEEDEKHDINHEVSCLLQARCEEDILELAHEQLEGGLA